MNNILVRNWDDKVILVVEDVDTNKLFFDAALRKTNAKIIWAMDGQEAVDLFKANKIDLVLMDLQMPEMNGYAATKILKDKYPQLTIVAQTAFAMSDDREKALDAGCDDYLAKPIKSKDLLSMVGKYLKI